MHPELEIFLNDAFESIQPTSPNIGRVVVEPDYEASPEAADKGGLESELARLLGEQSPDAAAVISREGFEVNIPASCRLLAKYVRRVTLHGDKLEGSWVEIAPPGNWI
jgi:hypothetical protein